MYMGDGNLLVLATKQLNKEGQDITLLKIINRAEKIRKLLDQFPVIGKKIINGLPLTPQEIYRAKQARIK